MDQVGRFVQRYLYDPEPINETPGVPILCLAKVYSQNPSSDPTFTQQQASLWPVEFLRDHEARFWFTYRTGFNKIMKDKNDQSLAVRLGKDGFTADTGFGCMIRSAQTLLANAISLSRLGRDWRRGLRQDIEAEIGSMFADDPEAPYSIHKFIEHGARACDTPAGQWFGPNAASRCIESLTHSFAGSGLRVYVASDQGGTVYEDIVLRLAQAPQGFSPLLILIPQRLGHERINTRYYDSLRSLFEVPQFVGIAGGRPSSAHYFFARQADKLFFLDPHFQRDSLPFHTDLSRYSDRDLDSLHTRRIRRMNIEDLDPSMLIGFLIVSLEDWRAWTRKIKQQAMKFSLVSISDCRPDYHTSKSSRHDCKSEVFSDEEGLQ